MRSKTIRIQKLTAQWRRKLLFRKALIAFGMALLCSAVIHSVFLLRGLAQMWLGGGCFVLIFMLLWRTRMHKKADAFQMARHLDRTFPELEESSHLFLKPESSLNLIERLQRNRVEHEFHQHSFSGILPNRSLARAAIFCLLTVLVVVLLNLSIWKNRVLNRSAADATAADHSNLSDIAESHPTPFKFDSVKILVQPPKYTGKPPQLGSNFNIEAPEGSEITWKFLSTQKIQNASLVFSSGDTLPLQTVDRRTFRVSRSLWHSEIYYLIFYSQIESRQFSDYFSIKIIKDRPPELRVIQPPVRQEIATDGPFVIPLKVSARDDYGLSRAEIVATVSKGAGEAVKFREQTLPFEQRIYKPVNRMELSTLLDLKKLGMQPGDELYFHVAARDNRQPQSNRSRSETRFVIWPDTSKTELTVSSGIAINPIPEYFRSQRQIIIDTEKLIKDKARLAADKFKRQCNNLGIDQKALRLRYGQFLGEESESGLDMDIVQERNADEPDVEETGFTQSFDSHEHEPGNPQESKPQDAHSAVPEQFIHQHDFEENATLFSQSVKSKLKAALSEMWEAELHLRTFQPEQALPYEYRALVFLKKVQQESRIYVKRIGMEPPPLKVSETRLSGDLEEIENRRVQKPEAREEDEAAVRQVLQILSDLANGETSLARDEIQTLQLAEKRLTQHALTNPASYLSALQDLRTLILSLENRRQICNDCLPEIARAFWRVLPLQQRLPEKPTTTSSDIFTIYCRKLGVPF
ncbi:MAG: hypothetical protein ACE5HS_08440 [bacterium]